LFFRSLRQHALSTIITALSIALAGGLLMSVWTVKEQSRATFTGVNGGFDAVLGARGSKLQLVLTRFSTRSLARQSCLVRLSRHQEQSECRDRHPIAVGDNYLGYRLVGTLPELLSGWNTRRESATSSGRETVSSTLRGARRWWAVSSRKIGA